MLMNKCLNFVKHIQELAHPPPTHAQETNEAWNV